MSSDSHLDQRLRHADPVHAGALPALPQDFLRYVRELDEPAGLLAARHVVDDAYTARQQRRSHRRRRSAVLVTAAAATVIAGLVIGVSPDRTPSAFADYDVTPTPLTAAQAQEQAEACRAYVLRAETLLAEISTDRVAGIASAVPTITERRGSWGFSLLVGTEQVYSCLLQGSGTEPSGFSGGGAIQPWTDGPGTEVTVDSRTSTQSVDGRDLVEAWGSAEGRATADVAAVDLIFPDGQTVHATLSGTWWAAWWPGQVDEDMQGGPTTVRYTTIDGRTGERPY